ncbi:mechanosensitive ion channel family protein [Ferrimonas sediminicola]|uniref:Mechanosensitive ion channel family protein n=1 Tax=Ferrimonas sediminicola TaxID=2569538 RepID=A0A4U1BAL5_9GAMM|nr:mechanosensitive ion channel family protein [Ferrimonas sediminicola]TKB47575.1 mechanosensitive ion channel family protein [Ferrimonas sediminicola]
MQLRHGWLWLCLLLPLSLQAQPPTLKNMMEQQSPQQAEEAAPEPQEPPPEPTVIDEYERGSPRSSMEGLLHALEHNDFERAAHYLDGRNLPAAMADTPLAELAEEFKLILNRTLWVDLQSMSESRNGLAGDGLPPYRDLVGRIPLGSRQISVYMQRVPRGDGQYIWKISNATLGEVPSLYAQYGDGPIGEYLSHHLPEFEILGLQSWQFVAVLLMFLLAYLISLPLFALLKWLARRSHPDNDQLQRFIGGPSRLLFVVLMVREAFPLVRPSIEARAIAEGHALMILALVWVSVSGMELARERLNRGLQEKGREQGAQLLKPLFTIAKILIIIVGLLMWLENLGFKATTILAGLGIGGLAVALAAQKSVENLIGAITLYLSSPVRVGNFCKFGTQMGVVEEIGLRYTRIRTLDRTVIHISNATFVDLELENFSEREKIRYSPALNLRYDTPASKLRDVMDEITEALKAHPRTHESPLRVRFHKFGPNALQLNVLSYIQTTAFPEYLEAAEELNLAILTILEKHGVAMTDTTQLRWLQAPGANRD